MAHVSRIPLISLMALSFAMPAMAQTPSAPTPAPQDPQAGGQRDVVVVTANKREESVQDIPVAVTAITAEQKEEYGIISVTDLSNVTPGFNYTAGNERVTIRGVGRNTNNFGADPGVANYNDGVYTAFSTLAGKDPIFTERVEVLRGPQGTLYGRNSIGGAINTVSKRPTDDFEAEFRLGAGNYDQRKVGFALSGPITDSIQYRVAAVKEVRDGVFNNYGTGDKEGYAEDAYQLDIQLEGQVGDNFTWWFKTSDLTYDRAGPPGGRTGTFSTAPYLPTQFQNGGSNLLGSYAFTNDSSLISFTQDGSTRVNPYATNGEQAFNSSAPTQATVPKYDEYILETIYSTGPFDIKYVGGYTFYDYRLYFDGDGFPTRSITYNAITGIAPIAACSAARALLLQPRSNAPAAAVPCITSTGTKTVQPSVDTRYRESRSFFSNELNFISTTDGPFQWIAGLYAYQENSQQSETDSKFTDAPAAEFRQEYTTGQILPNPGRRATFVGNDSIQFAYGIYGQGDYEINDQWKATLGLRYSYDLKKFQESAQAICYIICTGSFGATYDFVDVTAFSLTGALAAFPAMQPGVISATPTNFSGVTRTPDGVAHRTMADDWSAITGTAGIEYTPTSDTLLFAKYSRGHKAGGFNALAMAPLPKTNKEKVDAYEAGWKQEWSAIPLTTNAAAFYYQYSDVQTPLQVVTNPGVAGAPVYGIFANLPEVQTTGFELESVWNPTDELRIGFTYSYLNAEIQKTDVFRDPSRSATDPERDRTFEGNVLPFSPKNKVALNASYLFEFEDGSTLLPTLSWYWRDSFYSSPFNGPLQLTPDYQQTDARLTFNSADERWTIIGFARNLFDEEGYDAITADSFRTADNGRYQSITFTPPRFVGVELQFHFR